MSNPTAIPVSTVPPAGNGTPSLDHLITDDGKPVDNFFVEKQQRLLTAPLECSWAPVDGQPFVVASNVGLFFEPKNPAYCPDAMLALGVRLGEDLKVKPNRSYFVWLLHKVPDVVIEIVSDLTGGEEGHKMAEYARRGVPYYVIFDPLNLLGGGVLRVFACQQGVYEPLAGAWFASVGLGIRLWPGVYEDTTDVWLRWCDRDGRVIPTGKEKSEYEAQRAEQERQRAEQERQRAEHEAQRAEHEAQRAEQERQRAEQLRAQLRALGIDPTA
jgi:Uma2 family endonuclease